MSLEAAVIDKASDLSYEKSIKDFIGVGIDSHATAMNKIRYLGEIPNNAAPIKSNNRKVKTLFIEANEGYVAMHHGKGKISRLGYVHKGRRPVSKKINELINQILYWWK